MKEMRFYDQDNVLQLIISEEIYRYELNPRKYCNDDYFVNEPACAEIETGMNSFFETCADAQDDGNPGYNKIGSGYYYRGRVDIIENNNRIMTGLLDLSSIEINRKEGSVTFKIYDNLVQISEIKDTNIRIEYGSNYNREKYNFVVNPDDEDGNEFGVITDDKKISSVINAIFVIINHTLPNPISYQLGNISNLAHNSAPHEIDDGDGDSSFNYFFRKWLIGLISSATTMATGGALFSFYGLLDQNKRHNIGVEFGYFPTTDADCYLILTAGRNYESNHKIWWRVFALKKGNVVGDSGAHGNIIRNGNYSGKVNGQSLVTRIDLNATTAYWVNEYANWDVNIADTYAAYKCYYMGDLANGYDFNSLVLRLQVDSENGKYSTTMTLEQLLKLCLFCFDLAIYADSDGVLQLARKTGGEEIAYNSELITAYTTKMLYYAPYKKEELRKLVADPAFVDYLVDYYEGNDIMSQEVSLELYDPSGQWTCELGNIMNINNKPHVIAEAGRDNDNNWTIRLIKKVG